MFGHGDGTHIRGGRRATPGRGPRPGPSPWPGPDGGGGRGDRHGAERYLLGLLGTFASVALLLALLGVYGVTAQMIRERSSELAIRSAMGAAPATLLRTALVRAAVPLAFGVGAGFRAALPTARVLDSVVYGIPAIEPLTIAAAAAGVALAALAAATPPALRVRRTEPMRVLRDE